MGTVNQVVEDAEVLQAAQALPRASLPVRFDSLVR
jgi:hypothetical protein